MQVQLEVKRGEEEAVGLRSELDTAQQERHAKVCTRATCTCIYMYLPLHCTPVFDLGLSYRSAGYANQSAQIMSSPSPKV